MSRPGWPSLQQQVTALPKLPPDLPQLSDRITGLQGDVAALKSASAAAAAPLPAEITGLPQRLADLEIRVAELKPTELAGLTARIAALEQRPAGSTGGCRRLRPDQKRCRGLRCAPEGGRKRHGRYRRPEAGPRSTRRGENDNVALAEGQNKGVYKSTKSTTWDTIQLTAGQMIQFGNIYDTVKGQHDLTFQFSEANTGTGDPTTGTTFTLGGAGVDYIGGTVTPEPGSVSLLAIGAMGLLGPPSPCGLRPKR